MDSNQGHRKIQESRVYHVEERFSRARELFRFKAVTKNMIENALRIINEISAEEVQGENPSPFRREKYSLLHHYLDYLKRFSEGKV